MVSKEDGMSTKNSYSWHTLHKHTTFFLFSRFMIRWQKKRANTFTHQISPAFVSDWLEYLIHIHSNRRVSHISDCSLTSEDVSSGGGLILFVREEDA